MVINWSFVQQLRPPTLYFMYGYMFTRDSFGTLSSPEDAVDLEVAQ